MNATAEFVIPPLAKSFSRFVGTSFTLTEGLPVQGCALRKIEGSPVL